MNRTHSLRTWCLLTLSLAIGLLGVAPRASGAQPSSGGLTSADLLVWLEDQLQGFDELIPDGKALLLRWETASVTTLTERELVQLERRVAPYPEHPDRAAWAQHASLADSLDRTESSLYWITPSSSVHTYQYVGALNGTAHYSNARLAMHNNELWMAGEPGVTPDARWEHDDLDPWNGSLESLVVIREGVPHPIERSMGRVYEATTRPAAMMWMGIGFPMSQIPFGHAETMVRGDAWTATMAASAEPGSRSAVFSGRLIVVDGRHHFVCLEQRYPSSQAEDGSETVVTFRGHADRLGTGQLIPDRISIDQNDTITEHRLLEAALVDADMIEALSTRPDPGDVEHHLDFTRGVPQDETNPTDPRRLVVWGGPPDYRDVALTRNTSQTITVTQANDGRPTTVLHEGSGSRVMVWALVIGGIISISAVLVWMRMRK